MNNEHAPYGLKVILDTNIHPFPQPRIPEQNSQVSKEKPYNKPAEIYSNGQLITCNQKVTAICAEERFTYDVACKDLHPYPLPEIPLKNEEVIHKNATHTEDSIYSQFDELWDFPQPEWPENKKEFRLRINLNPLQLRKKTICCLFLMATVIALLIGMTVTIMVLMEQVNEITRGKKH